MLINSVKKFIINISAKFLLLLNILKMAENYIIYIGTFQGDQRGRELELLQRKLSKTQREIRLCREKLDRVMENLNEIEEHQLKCACCRKTYEQVIETSGFSSLNCGHVFCNHCQLKYMLCPICKVSIVKRSKIFI